MVSNIEVCLPEKISTPNNIGEGLKGPYRQFWKEALFLKYNKNNIVSIFSDTILIKSLPKVTKILRSLIDTSLK